MSANTPEIRLHWLNDSRADRIVFALEELGLKYDVSLYKRDAAYRQPALEKVHPLGKSPIVEVNGKVLAESGLILDYLVEKFGANTELGKPLSEDDRWKVKYALHHAEGTLMPHLVTLLLSTVILRPQNAEMADTFESAFTIPDIQKQAKFLNDELEANGTGYFVSDHLTIADVMYLYPVSAIADRAKHVVDMSELPALSNWLKMIRARDTHKKTLEIVAGFNKKKTDSNM